MSQNEDLRPPFNPNISPFQNANPLDLDKKNPDEQRKALFVGDQYQHYYKEKFALITPKKQMAGFNVAAFFLTFAWFFYRKMYAVGFGLFALIFVIGLICQYLNFTPPSMGIGISVLYGLMGNAIYKQFVEKKISNIQKSHSQSVDINTEIQKQGGTSLLAGGITLTIMVLLTVFAFMSE